MSICTCEVVVGLVLASIGILAWCRWKNVGGKLWALRIIPLGIILQVLVRDFTRTDFRWPALIFAVYAFAVYRGGWRLKRPQNRVLRGICWWTHLVVYFLVIYMFFIAFSGSVIVATSLSGWAPLGLESGWPWTRGEITEELPFAVEYKRAPTFSAEYDKRILFKSGKRIGLLCDTGGYGPFRVYRLNDGNYCLEEGRSYTRYLRVNAESETVEMRLDGGWFPLPEKGYVRGWSKLNDLNLSFSMYSGGSFNEKGWRVSVKGTPVGDSLVGMKLIGEIDTSGKFTLERSMDPQMKSPHN